MFLDCSPEAHKEFGSLLQLGVGMGSSNFIEIGGQSLCSQSETHQSIMMATKILEMGADITCSKCMYKMSVKNFLQHV